MTERAKVPVPGEGDRDFRTNAVLRAVVLEQVGEGVILADAAGRITFVNEAAKRLHGASELGVGVEGWTEAYHLLTIDGEPHPPDELPLARALRRREMVRAARWRIRRPDGSEVVAEGTATPLAAEDGTSLGAVLVLRDVTALHDSEIALRASATALREGEDHYRHAVELNPQVPWTADPEGGILDFSQRWLDLTGLTREQALGAGWARVPHTDDLPAMAQAWQHSVRTGDRYDVEHRIRLADGSYRWMRSRASPRRDAAGRIVRWYGATEDIEERKQADLAREAMIAGQRRFLREVLFGFTEGRLRLCDTDDDLPSALAPTSETIALSPLRARELRHRTQAAAEAIGFSDERMQDLVTGVGEAAMNAVRHGGGGHGRVHADAGAGIVQVWVRDTGPGIAEDLIHRAVERHWTTGGFGQGFWLMLRTCDRLYLLTGPGGTTVVLEQARYEPEPQWLLSPAP